MRKPVLLLSFVLLFLSSHATHITGGEMLYQYLGPGASPNTSSYRITLRLFRDELNVGGAPMPTYVWVGIFDNDTQQQYPGPLQHYVLPQDSSVYVPIEPFPPCMINPPALSYKVGYFNIIVDLPDNQNGYTCTYNTCCRVHPMVNVDYPAAQGTGSTYICRIPGFVQLPVGHNSSPSFDMSVSAICFEKPFTFSFHATDPDGNSLVYSFTDAYDHSNATSAADADPPPPNPTYPYYQPVPYINGFSSAAPLGNLAMINTGTGIISGTAPPQSPLALNPEKYVVAVMVKEYRNGVFIAEHTKDFIMNVSACSFSGVNVGPDFTTCDGFTLNFNNYVANPPGTLYHWDFGVTTVLNDTSNIQNPTYTYPDTGVYIVKLTVTLPGGACIDSGTKVVRVFPGFLPGFITSPALCVGMPVQFTDTTYNQYGYVDSWSWNFGDPATLADTSHLQNPAYTYSPSGIYNVQLIVTNSKGCIDTVYKNITVSDLPTVSVFPHDTTYCGLDSLQLTATGTGNFSWSPLTSIIGANTATPLVFPAVPTRYVVTLISPAGCPNKDSLNITPRFDLTNNIAGPSLVCELDTVTLSGSCNYPAGLAWQWSPAATAESPNSAVTRVYPVTTTTYTLSTRWGNNCVATKNHLVTVTPLAIPHAGPDAFVCGGSGPQGSVQLNASGGVSYQWTPATGLSNPNIPNPVASPTVPTYYVVAVGVAGCSRLRTDTVFVNVDSLPSLSTSPDTLICNIDTLQILATGAGNFNWSPNYMISNTTVANPLVSPDLPTWYHVRLTDAIGCHSDNSVFIDVKDHVTLSSGPDTTICQTDGFRLATTSDALHYLWLPPTYLDDNTLKNPFTRPPNSITYHVIGNIGKCQSDAYVNIKVVPYPIAIVGPDAIVCLGFQAQLNASGGSSYLWSPSTFLNNRLIPNPTCINPTGNIRYTVTVRDTLGCPKPSSAQVWVRVYPRVTANAGPRDTTVVEGEPLLLNATGGTNYLWTPVQWLNNPYIPNPVALPHDNIIYVVQVSSPAGCLATDTISVRLFKVTEDIYVPTAFTPNGDGLNDLLRPILLGMKSLTYFRVYNRFGQMVFATSEIGKGWDGRFLGKPQDPATFVWMAEGVTYKGLVKRKKGYAVLIRE